MTVFKIKLNERVFLKEEKEEKDRKKTISGSKRFPKFNLRNRLAYVGFLIQGKKILNITKIGRAEEIMKETKKEGWKI